MNFDEDELWSQYAVDGTEALRDIEQSVLAIESDPGQAEHINRLYRGLHTLKGNSAIIGLKRIEALAHASEDLIGLTRDRAVPLDEPMVELMLEVVDLLQEVVVVAGRDRRDAEESRTGSLTARVREMFAARGAPSSPVAEGPPAGPAVAAAPAPIEELPPIEQVDPSCDAGFVEVFLSLAREGLPHLGSALASCINPDSAEEGRRQLREQTEDLGLAAERMGYVHVVDLLARLNAAVQGDGAWAETGVLELELYGQVVAIEERYRTLTATPQSFGLESIYQRGCANAAFGDLARLRDLLAAPEQMGPVELRSLFKRLHAACTYYGFAGGAQSCLEHEDRLCGAVESALLPSAETVQQGFDFVERLGQTIHAVNAGEERADVPGLLREAEDDPMKFAPETAALPMSAELRHQLSRTALGALTRVLERSWTILEIHAELERAPALSEPFLKWMEQSGTVLVTSAVVDHASGPPVYHFLVGTPLPLAEAQHDLRALDATGRLLTAHRLEIGGTAAPASIKTALPTPMALVAPATPVREAKAAAAAAPPSDATPPAEAPPAVDKESDGEAAGHDRGKTEFLRIDARKVSLIMDLAGELGLASSAVTHHPDLEGQELEGYSAAAHKLEMLIRELQNEVSAMRLVPVAGVFQRMKRVVRDTARRTNKKVELVLVGEETEIDKLMVDSLHDPLVHMLRNAIDHGIETPEERERVGKPPVGRIVLEASHQGGEVSVQVSDDGRGLDRERIVQRARERGLIPAGAELTEQQVLDLVFLPGFSTKEQIDELSGRGVGMDVIKTTIEGLRGRVHIRSTAGRGSGITMRVPLTLAFVEAMVVRERDRLFALPIERVFQVFKAEVGQVSRNSADGQTLVRVHDKLLPVLWLHRYYGEVGERDETLEGRIVVVVQTSQGGVALPVDTLLGNQQVMLKPLKGALAGVRAAAGCGMLRSGDVALTLDCEQLHG